jgi:hypothetical protein
MVDVFVVIQHPLFFHLLGLLLFLGYFSSFLIEGLCLALPTCLTLYSTTVVKNLAPPSLLRSLTRLPRLRYPSLVRYFGLFSNRLDKYA